MSADTTNLQIYLKLNELRQGQGNNKEVHDFSKNEYHGIIQGKPTPTADDRFGSCLNIGSEDSIKIDKQGRYDGIDLLSAENPSFTLGFWFKPMGADVLLNDAILLMITAQGGAKQHKLSITQKVSQLAAEVASQSDLSLQIAIDDQKLIHTTPLSKIKQGEWNHIAIALNKTGEEPNIEIYLNELKVELNTEISSLVELNLENCILEIAPQGDQKFMGQVAHLRIYSGLLSLTELQKKIQDDETTIAAFNKSHPIEFDLHNENDENILYICDTDEQSLILEITNTSAEDIEFQVPAIDAEAWSTWQASESCYHFQLSFRPGTLSDASIKMMQSLLLRLAGLSQGWDCVYDPDNDNLVDWISFLWVGDAGKQLVEEFADKKKTTTTKLQGLFSSLKEQITLLEEAEIDEFLQTIEASTDTSDPSAVLGEDLGNGRYGIRKKGTGVVELCELGAAAGGGARGTRVHLKYDRLSYSAPVGRDATQVPSGTRSQFLNIINKQGKATIPLHMSFVGSNTILNDGVTNNKLTLRIANLQNEALNLEGGNGIPQFRIYFDFEDHFALYANSYPLVASQTSEAIWEPKEEARDISKKDGFSQDQTQAKDWKKSWAIASLNNAQKIRVSGRDEDDQKAWSIVEQDLQTDNPHWLLEPKLRDGVSQFAAKESFEFLIEDLVSDAPDGFANLYVEYKNIPGYWDGRIICPIEKAPLVYRQRAVGIGMDHPIAKLHISVKQENAVVGLKQQKPAAVFEGGNVGIGVTDPKIHLAIGDNDTGLQQQGDGELAIYTNDRERVRINQYGYLGIGETKPKTELHVNGTITATTFVGHGAVVPGMILMWSGTESDIPSGWHLCDGTEGTPDLRSRFLVGAISDIDNEYKPGERGEADTHTHTIRTPQKNIITTWSGTHSHRPPQSWYRFDHHDVSAVDKSDYWTLIDCRGGDVVNQQTTENGEHDHTVLVEIDEFSSDSNRGQNRPKWYAICFIMKL